MSSHLIHLTDAETADLEWSEREADVLADADFVLDPEALENVVGLDAVPFNVSGFPAFDSREERDEYEAWLDAVELALSWGAN